MAMLLATLAIAPLAGALASGNGPHAPGSWGAQPDGTFHNPVLPADYSDIDCIRVGDEYYAISSTMQFSPGMAILHSKGRCCVPPRQAPRYSPWKKSYRIANWHEYNAALVSSRQVRQLHRLDR
jgi:hypothetical protein